MHPAIFSRRSGVGNALRPDGYPIHGEPHDIGEFGLNRQ